MDHGRQKLLKQFAKYGNPVIGFNLLVTLVILVIAFPAFSDLRLLYFFLVMIVVCFILLNVYYLGLVRSILRLFSDMAGNLDALGKVFRSAPGKTMGANILTVVLFYTPTIPVMYFLFGYTNLYYHFYVFCISFFIFVFLGYNSMSVWYGRTYPLGRLGIPVAVQGLGSKIISDGISNPAARIGIHDDHALSPSRAASSRSPSMPGYGTTWTILLPALRNRMIGAAAPGLPGAFVEYGGSLYITDGSGTILNAGVETAGNTLPD